jgi:hypothetical protein
MVLALEPRSLAAAQLQVLSLNLGPAGDSVRDLLAARDKVNQIPTYCQPNLNPLSWLFVSRRRAC